MLIIDEAGMVWVALRKESVDRKIFSRIFVLMSILSLSARRAWIENLASGINPDQSGVALRKESVDRKIRYLTVSRVSIRRSPQGERG